MGIAFGPDGAMYISDSVKGKIWKVTYTGKRDDFGEKQLMAMAARKKESHIRTPHVEKDNLLPENLVGGAKIYQQYCSACHQMNGKGASGRFPPLMGTDWVTGDKERLIKVLLNGMEGSLKIGDEVYNGAMPQHRFLNDGEIAQVLTYIRSSFGNEASEVSADEVEQLRNEQNKSGKAVRPVKATTE
jgi:mono/diheme cytochrome c family protein